MGELSGLAENKYYDRVKIFFGGKGGGVLTFGLQNRIGI